jgi:hypothetical protein
MVPLPARSSRMGRAAEKDRPQQGRRLPPKASSVLASIHPSWGDDTESADGRKVRSCKDFVTHELCRYPDFPSCLGVKNENNAAKLPKSGGFPMAFRYDPVLLLLAAQGWRQCAETADPGKRTAYRIRAAEAEVRATLSLKTPIVKESAVPEDDVRMGEPQDHGRISSPPPARAMQMTDAIMAE